MKLLSLISIIDFACIDEEVLYAYLLHSLFQDSQVLLLMDKLVWVMSGRITQLRKVIKVYNSYVCTLHLQV